MNKRKYVVSALAVALSVGCLGGVNNNSNFNPISISHAAEFPLQETSTKLIIHKLSYDLKEGEEKPVIDNKRGKELTDLPAGVSNFDIKKYGDVTFTLYKLTNNEGKDVLVEDFKGAVVSDDKTTVTIGDATYKLVKIEDKNIDEAGKAEFSNQGNGSYLISETSANKNLVGEKEQDQLFSLPLANDEGTGFLDTLHLYPKNDVENLIFKLSKYLDQKGVGHELKDIEFTLYKGEPGSGTVYNDKLTLKTNEKGEVEISDIPIGKYYLVEKNPKENTTAYYAQNDKYNILKFDIGNLAKDKYMAEFINYTEPKSEKHVNDGRHDDSKERNNGIHVNTKIHDFNIGDTIPFEYSLDVKADIMGGEKVNVGDKVVIKKPYGKFEAYDNPADKKLIIPTKEGTLSQKLNLKISMDGVNLVENTDYKVEKADDGFKLNFITREVEYTDVDGNKSQVPAVSETVAKTVKADGSSKIKVNYDYELTKDALPEEMIENELKFIYNNHPSNSEEFDKVQLDKDNVITYGKKFKKTTRKAGGFLADADVKIAGAKFHLYKMVDGKKQYLTEKDNKRVFKEGEKAPEDALVLESDKDGLFEIKGLKTGEYFIEEFFAPVGYRLNNTPLKFSVGDGTYAGDKATVDHFENTKDGELPMTGDDVLRFYVFAGGVALAAGFRYAHNKRKNKEESGKLA